MPINEVIQKHQHLLDRRIESNQMRLECNDSDQHQRRKFETLF